MLVPDLSHLLVLLCTAVVSFLVQQYVHVLYGNSYGGICKHIISYQGYDMYMIRYNGAACMYTPAAACIYTAQINVFKLRGTHSSVYRTIGVPSFSTHMLTFDNRVLCLLLRGPWPPRTPLMKCPCSFHRLFHHADALGEPPASGHSRRRTSGAATE